MRLLLVALVAVIGGCDFQHDLGGTTSGGGGPSTGGTTSSSASTSGGSSGGSGAGYFSGCGWQVFYPDAGSGCMLLPTTPCEGHDWALRCDGTTCNCLEDGVVFASIPQMSCNSGDLLFSDCPGFTSLTPTTGGGLPPIGMASPSGGGGPSTPLASGCAWHDSVFDGGCTMTPASACEGHQDQVICEGTTCSCIQDGTALASGAQGDACTSFAVNAICPAFKL